MLKAEVRHADRRRNKKFSEEEVRVKAFLIEEVRGHPNLWRKWGSGVPGKRAGSQGCNSIDILGRSKPCPISCLEHCDVV